MKQFPIHQLAHFVGAEVQVGNADFFTGINIDTRTIQAGQCFVAIKGANFDGHDYVPLAFEKGAACAIVNSDYDLPEGKTGVLIKVPDPILALGVFARAWRRLAWAKIVAITGSAGKTTTRHMTYHVLSKFHNCHSAIKSFNNNIGVPLTILGIEDSHDVAIIELGSNHPGEIEYLSKIAQPDLAVIVNAFDAHIENFGSVQAIIKEKTSIVAGLKKSGLLIINNDSPGLPDFCLSEGYKFISFGKTSHADIHATDIALAAFGSEFKVDGVRVHLPVPGKGNIDNALAAWAICKNLGVSAKDFAAAIVDFCGVDMRLEPIKLGEMLVISDCYNANPASMRNALEILQNIAAANPGKRVVFVCGPMMELGEHSASLHAQIGQKAALSGVNMLLSVGPFADIVEKAAQNEQVKSLQTQCFENTEVLCNKLSNLLRKDDIILVKGSRSARLERAVEKIRELFAV